MYNSHNIAIRIKEIAAEKNVLIKNMLDELGLGSNTMSAMYHGKSLSSESLAKIADYLGVSVDYLLGRDLSPAPEKSSVVSALLSELSDSEIADVEQYIRFIISKR
mgnify:CR=1 FL=1